MAKQDYVPKRDGDLKTWANNLKAKIVAVGASLGLTPAEIIQVQTTAQAIIDDVDTFAQAKTDFQQAGNTKQTNQTSNVRGLRTFAQRMKTSPNYTAAIGEDLGLVGDEQTVDIPNSKPALKHAKVPSGHQFGFNLVSFFDGVNIYKKLPKDATFSFLARDTGSPYIDTAAVENGTEYYAFYVLGDTEAGQRSDVVIVSV